MSPEPLAIAIATLYLSKMSKDPSSATAADQVALQHDIRQIFAEAMNRFEGTDIQDIRQSLAGAMNQFQNGHGPNLQVDATEDDLDHVNDARESHKMMFHQIEKDCEILTSQHLPSVDGWAYPYQVFGRIVIHLMDLKVRKDAKKKAGTKYMEGLCDIADRHQVIVTLNPGVKDKSDPKSHWKSTTSYARLVRWYRTLGFKPNRVGGRYELKGSMYRSPGKISPNLLAT